MAPPVRAFERGVQGDGLQVVYMDDRSGLCRSVPALRRALRFWDDFAVGAGLRTNEAKTQIWGRA
eukprot:5717882-Alexandrium_andersonii.AAC.1